MHSGKLRHRIELQVRSEAVDELGTPTDVWTTFLRTFASIEDRRGREYVESNQAITNETTAIIMIRYRPGVQPEQRVVDVCSHGHCNGQMYHITNVRDQLGRQRDLTLEAEKIRANVEVVV